MKAVAVGCALFLLACGEDAGHRPMPPTGGSGGVLGSGGAGGMGGADGGGGQGGADAASTTITGRVCTMSSIDSTLPCSPTGLRPGSAVSIAGTNLSASVDPTTGDFTLDAAAVQSPALLLFDTGSSPFENAAMSVVVPSDAVALRTVADTLLLDNMVIQNAGGWAMVYAVDANGAPQPNVRVQNAPGRDVFYDDSAGRVFDTLTQTGSAGLALFNNVPAGTLAFDLAPPSGPVVHVELPIVLGRVSIIRVPVVP